MKLSKKNLNKMLIWGGVILIILVMIYIYNKKLFIENFDYNEKLNRPLSQPDSIVNIIKKQDEYDKCISKNLKTPFASIAKKCKIENGFNCDVYFKNDPNNIFKSKVINNKCSPFFEQNTDYMKIYANNFECKSPTKKYSKLYDSNGNILTYNKDKNNKGWIEYKPEIFNKYIGVVQQNIECM